MGICDKKKKLISLCNSVYYKFISTKFVVKGVKKTYGFSIIKNEKYQPCLNTWSLGNTLRKINKRRLSK